MSKQFENDLAKELHRATDSEVRTYRCGYSGSNAMPQPDFLVTTAQQNHGVEAKGPIQQDHVYIEADDLDQLVECQNSYTDVYLAVKFPHRQMLVVQYYPQVSGDGIPEDYYSMDTAEQFRLLIEISAPAFDPHVTDSGTLRVEKPETDSDWNTARSGYGDVTALSAALGIPVEEDDVE